MIGIQPNSSTDDAEPPSGEPHPDATTLFNEVIRLAIVVAQAQGIRRSEAEELAFQAGSLFWHSRGTEGAYDRARPLEPWVARVVLNLIGEERRRADAADERSATYQRDAERYEPDWMNSESPAMDQDALGVYYRALNRLPAVCREVFRLRTEQQLSIPEIASQLELAEGTVRVHVRNAREHLNRDHKLYTYLKEGR